MYAPNERIYKYLADWKGHERGLEITCVYMLNEPIEGNVRGQKCVLGGLESPRESSRWLLWNGSQRSEMH